MKKMVFVRRQSEERVQAYFREIDAEVDVLLQEKYDGQSAVQGTVFFPEEYQVDTLVRMLASKNPGAEIMVFRLEKVGQCPAGDFVEKNVTEDGTLPV
jgi:hypothetical protein